MQRLTFYEIRQSRLPQSVGLCAADAPNLQAIVNEAQERLIMAGGNEGWWGGWAKMAANVIPCTDPYIVTPSDVARIINIDICNTPVRIQNEFYEFLEFGNGLMQRGCQNQCGNLNSCSRTTQAFDRGQYPTAVDLTAGRKIRVYYTNAADRGKRVFIGGTDNNDQPIYTLDSSAQVNGFFLTMISPYVESTYTLNTLSQLHKEVTYGPVSIYDVDQTTFDETLLVTLAPQETNPAYRRYYLDSLPPQCPCNSTSNTVQVTVMVKLDYKPVTCDSDTLIIQSRAALKEECMSIRFSEMDTPNSKAMADLHHKRAIKILNGQLVHYMGKEMPAIQFRPFGNQRLENNLVQMI